MRTIKRTGAYTFLFITLLLLCTIVYVFVVYQRNIEISFLVFIMMLTVCSLLLFNILSKGVLPITIPHRYIWRLLFVLYMLLLAYLLFFSKEFARDRISNVSLEAYLPILKYEWTYGTNLIPFSSIRDMLSTLSSPIYQMYSIVNLFGNLIAFMPFAFFINILHEKMSKTYFFLLLSCIVVCVELTQFLTMSGTLDIDDFLLNVFGGVLVYAILKIKFLQSLLKKIR